MSSQVADAARRRKALNLRSVWNWALRTRTLRAVPLARGDWTYLAVVYVLSRLLIVLVGIVGSAMFPTVGPNQTWALQPITWTTLDRLVRIFDHFDSGWYIQISHGYPPVVPGSPGAIDALRVWGFYPGYPIVLHGVAIILTVLGVPGPVDDIAGAFVSYASLAGAIVYLYRLTAGELDRVAARRAVAYLLVFPTALFLSAVYPQSLLLLTTVGAFYHARRRQWLAAGLFSAVACVTHSEGMVALGPVTVEFLAYYWQTGGWFQWGMLKLGWLLGPSAAALGAYALYSHQQTTYWLAFSASEKYVWGKRLSPPIYPFIGFILHPNLGSAFDFDFHLLNLAVAAAALALCVVAFKRLPFSYGVSILLGVLLPLSANGHYTFSLARYVGTLFALFVAMAAWALRERWEPDGSAVREPTSAESLDLRDRAILLPSLIMLGIFTVMFTAGVWAAI